MAGETAEAWWNQYRRDQIELKQLRELVQDFADHGLRFDLNPTVFQRGVQPYIDYIKRMDDSVRDRAKAALEH